MTPIILSNFDINEIKYGMRVQSLSTKSCGEVALVDKPSDLVWIEWYNTGAIIPHIRIKADDIFSIE